MCLEAGVENIDSLLICLQSFNRAGKVYEVQLADGRGRAAGEINE
jgi:hypothetical protein